jgi:hypothetical protein
MYSGMIVSTDRNRVCRANRDIKPAIKVSF